MRFRDIYPLNVRFPVDLRERIEKSSKKNRRSLNAEILAGMQDYYEGGNNLKKATNGELIDELIRRFGRDAVSVSIKIEDKQSNKQEEQTDAKDG